MTATGSRIAGHRNRDMTKADSHLMKPTGPDVVVLIMWARAFDERRGQFLFHLGYARMGQPRFDRLKEITKAKDPYVHMTVVEEPVLDVLKGIAMSDYFGLDEARIYDDGGHFVPSVERKLYEAALKLIPGRPKSPKGVKDWDRMMNA